MKKAVGFILVIISISFIVINFGCINPSAQNNKPSTGSSASSLSLSSSSSSSSASSLSSSSSSSSSSDFVTVWSTLNTSTGSTASNQIQLPLESSGVYNFTVYWGDGNSDTITAWDSPKTTHTYASTGTYTVTIRGTIKGFSFNNSGDCLKLLVISSWGGLNFGNSGSYFAGANNLEITATDTPDLTGTTNLGGMFDGCNKLTTVPNMNTWNVSNVTDMSYMFSGASSFNQNIGSWNVSNVTNMECMLSYTHFNQDIASWNVSNVTNMSLMFYGATSFNQNIGSWNVSNVKNMSDMFLGASVFNQNIGTWNISNVTDMQDMFSGLTLSTSNYSAILIGWAGLPSLKSNVLFDAGFSKYNAGAAAARNTLVSTYGWNISDGGLE